MRLQLLSRRTSGRRRKRLDAVAMNPLKKLIIIFLKKSEDLSALACRLTKITGKSKFLIHPKHLIKVGRPWYTKYINKEDLILDVGCGNGERSLEMSKIAKEVVAFDIDEKSLREAKKKQQQRVKNLKFLKIDANKKLPFKDNLFDLVLCQDVLEHVKDYRKTTREVIRVLKKRGLFLLTLPNKETSWKRLKKAAGQFWFSDRGHVKEWDLKEIENFPKETCLQLIKKEPVVYDTPLTGFIDLLGGISLSSYKRLVVWKRKKALRNPEESTGFSLVLKKE